MKKYLTESKYKQYNQRRAKRSLFSWINTSELYISGTKVSLV